MGDAISGGDTPKGRQVCRQPSNCEPLGRVAHDHTQPPGQLFCGGVCAGTLKPSQLMGLPADITGQPGGCFGGEAARKVFEMLGSLGGQFRKMRPFHLSAGF